MGEQEEQRKNIEQIKQCCSFLMILYSFAMLSCGFAMFSYGSVIFS